MSAENDADVSKQRPNIPLRAEMLQNQRKQRRFFDSGDYAMSKAGRSPEPGQEIGREHPIPEQIPHLSPLLGPGTASPVRRPSSLAQESNAVRVAAARRSDANSEDAILD